MIDMTENTGWEDQTYERATYIRLMQVYIFNLCNFAVDLNLSKRLSPPRQLHEVVLPFTAASLSVKMRLITLVKYSVSRDHRVSPHHRIAGK